MMPAQAAPKDSHKYTLVMFPLEKWMLSTNKIPKGKLTRRVKKNAAIKEGKRPTASPGRFPNKNRENLNRIRQKQKRKTMTKYHEENFFILRCSLSARRLPNPAQNNQAAKINPRTISFPKKWTMNSRIR